MPSLPELEVYRSELTPQLTQSPVSGVDALDYRVVRVEVERLKSQLVGQSFQGLNRYGKWLIFDFGAPEQVVLHLGLTGKLNLLDPADELPKYPAFVFHFQSGRRLVMSDQRKLGRLYLRSSGELKADKRLGPDLLAVNEDQFVQLLRRKRRGARDVLMDQHVLAGIGGKYADEVLWQARLHPNTKLDQLSDAQLRELYRLTLAIHRQAIALGADVERFPGDWLIPHRHSGQVCPRCGSSLTERKLGGSETFYYPKDQPVPNPFRSG